MVTMTEEVDVVVVGAGIAGASGAWALSEHADVVVVETEAQAGSHATGRSAAVISETSGCWEVCALAAASRPFLTEPPDGFASAPLLGERGLLWVADDSGQTALDEIMTTAHQVGVEIRDLTAAEATAVVPALRADWIRGAALEPQAMSIDVAGLLDGYLRGLRHRGGRLLTGHPARSITVVGGGFEVDLGDVVVRCRSLVDAAGAWADQVAELAGLAPLGLTPLRRSAFTFPCHDHDTARWPLVMDAGSSFYFEPDAGGLLASPADETPSAPCDARASELDVGQAVDALAEATTLSVRGVRSTWAGLRTFAPDRRPVVGEDPRLDGFFWVAGQGGAGIKTAPAMAELTAALVLDRPRPSWVDAHGLDLQALHPGRWTSPATEVQPNPPTGGG